MKGILVHLNNTDRCQARLDVTITLALRHQAHLTGIGISIGVRFNI